MLALGGSGETAQRSKDLLIELGPSIAPDLYLYLQDRDPGVRGAVCELLAELGDTNAIDRMTPLLSDSNTRVADRANRSIEKLRRRGAASTQP